jgi:hypothetical protein
MAVAGKWFAWSEQLRMSTTLDSQQAMDHSAAVSRKLESQRNSVSVTRPWGRSAASWRNRAGIFMALGAIALSAAAAIFVGLGSGPSDTGLIYHTVSRTDLPIVVTERGNLEVSKTSRSSAKWMTFPVMA